MKKSISGKWQFKLDKEMIGIKEAYFSAPFFDDEIELPTTTSEAKKGEKNTEKNKGFLTDHYSFEGYAWYALDFDVEEEFSNKLAKLTLERTRYTSLWLDGKEISGVNAINSDSICAPHYYMLGRMSKGKHRIVILVDNCKEHYAIGGGHMTSPDTQTNWNGIVGEISIDYTDEYYLLSERTYPNLEEKSVDIELELCGEFLDEISRRNESFSLPELVCDIRIRCNRLKSIDNNKRELDVVGHIRDIRGIRLQKSLRNIDGYYSVSFELPEEVKTWDEYNPNVYVADYVIKKDKNVLLSSSVRFGFRKFSHEGITLKCNDEAIFLRGTHDGLIYPITGYAPMDLDSWFRTYGISKDYGFNHYRYHTCVPPKAAFEVADYLGIYLQPELPLWGSLYDEEDENFNEKEDSYIRAEGYRILDAFGDSPSFFAMSMGNELWGSKERIDSFVAGYKEYDNRHLYTQGSNNHQFVPSVQSHDDFFSNVRFDQNRLFRGSYAMCDAPLGFVQTTRPDACVDYDDIILPKTDTVATGEEDKTTITIQYGTGTKEVEATGVKETFIPNVPVLSHEIGQYEMMPDFSTIKKYTGVLEPENLLIFKERLRLSGLLPRADEFFKASAKLAFDCYKRELEAAHRSGNLSGYQILDFKDFTGQGTALVGMMDPFLDSKGIMSQSEIKTFNCDAVLLPEIRDFVVGAGDKIKVPVKLRYYRPEALDKITLTVTWLSKNNPLRSVNMQTFDLDTKVSGRGLFEIGELDLNVPMVEKNELYSLVFRIKNTDISNGYEFFVYEPTAKLEPKNALVTNDYNKMAEAIEEGRSVLYFPEKPNPARVIKGDYCSDFWCYTMFRQISESVNKPVANGTMGLLIDDRHPALSGFTTRDYSTPQWYEMVQDTSLTILDGIKNEPIRPIVEMIDNIERNHNLGLIYELGVEKGKLLICTANLPKLMEEREHLYHLYNSLVSYVDSERFAPSAMTDMTVIKTLFDEEN